MSDDLLSAMLFVIVVARCCQGNEPEIEAGDPGDGAPQGRPQRLQGVHRSDQARSRSPTGSVVPTINYSR